MHSSKYFRSMIFLFWNLCNCSLFKGWEILKHEFRNLKFLHFSDFMQLFENRKSCITVVTSTTQSISAGVLLDLSHNNEHLVFLTKDKPWCVPTQKGSFHSRGILRMGSPKGIKPRDRAELLRTLITKGSLQSLMWSSPTVTLIAKGSSQNLVRSRTQGY